MASHPSPVSPAHGDGVTGKGGNKERKESPFSVEKVMAALESVAKEWKHVGKELCLPNATLNRIRLECSSHVERLRVVVIYWFLKDPCASWRRLVWALGKAKEAVLTKVADSLRSHLEKVTDASFTCDNVLEALSSVTAGDIGKILSIPFTKRMDLRQSCQESGVTYRESLVSYFVETSPYASWEWVVGRLLYWEMGPALQRVKEYIKAERRDPTLTHANLSRLLEDVKDWELLLYHLDLPRSDDILKQQSLDEALEVEEMERKAFCAWYLSHHPNPSWSHVDDALYCSREHEVLEVLREEVHYLRGSRECRRLFAEAMREDGYVESQLNTIILCGGAGTGKSSFLALLFGNSPPDPRTSTPLATRPMSVFHVDLMQDKWEKLSPQEQKEVLVRAIIGKGTNSTEEGGKKEEGTASGNGDIMAEKKPATDSVPGNSDSCNIGHTPTQPPGTKPRPPDSPTSVGGVGRHDASQRGSQAIINSISTYDDLLKLMGKCSRTGEPVTSYRKIIFIDSGGQPQFHEMLPAFLRRMNLYIFVFKLSEELSAKSLVEYFDKTGEAIGRPYPSSHSSEQLLQYCLHAIHTQLHTHNVTSGKTPKIMIVGSHRDEEDKCSSETREDKKRKLAELLLPAFRNEVTYPDSGAHLDEEDFIFAVNAKNPEEADKALARSVQRLIVTKLSPEPTKVPLRYYCLEIVLEEVTQALGRGVLSIDECLQAASKLHFDRHTLRAALEFLTEISAVFYFPEVLEGVVFTDSQVLLDKATEMVEKMHRLRAGAEVEAGIVSIELQEFKHHALFTMEFLDGFPKHYIPGLFTSEELVKLFKSFHVMSEYTGTKFFMPALLSVLDDVELSKRRVPITSPAAAFALEFPSGGPCLGIFCTLICLLISKPTSPWKVELHPSSNKPACLYRNCIRFSVPPYPGSVTLIDTFSHFEVHVQTASTLYGEACTLVREDVIANVKKAARDLGYGHCIPTALGVVCPCGVGGAHVATLKMGVCTCRKDGGNKYRSMDARHSVWVKENSSQKDGVLTLRDLLFFPSSGDHNATSLNERIGSRDYFKFGMQLLDDTDDSRISNIETECRGIVPDINRKVFSLWLKGKGVRPVAWPTLVTVLESIGLKQLADDIRKVKLS